MIIATVITCPARWASYQRLRQNFDSLQLGCPLRTFQTSQDLESPQGNSNLNARGALAYGRRHLDADGSNWLLFLEDDVILEPDLADVLPRLIAIGAEERVDCWYLCNRRNGVRRLVWRDGLALNELEGDIQGSHALLIPRRHVDRILEAPWSTVVDRCIFAALSRAGGRILQVVHPILARHVGEHSTYAPERKQKLEVNVAN